MVKTRRVKPHGFVAHLVYHIRLAWRIGVILWHLFPRLKRVKALGNGTTLVGDNLSAGLVFLVTGLFLASFPPVLAVFGSRRFLRLLNAVDLQHHKQYVKVALVRVMVARLVWP